jgi:hypothetical protein
VKLAVSIADQELEPVGTVAELHEQVAGLLGDPGPGGVGSDPAEVNAATVVLDHDEDVKAAQNTVSTWAKSTARELSPGRTGPSGRRIEPRVLEDRPCVLNAERSRCRSGP